VKHNIVQCSCTQLCFAALPWRVAHCKAPNGMHSHWNPLQLRDRKEAVRETMEATRAMWDRLEKKPSSAFEDVFLEGLDHFPLSPANIHQLQRLREKVGLRSMQFPVAHALYMPRILLSWQQRSNAASDCLHTTVSPKLFPVATVDFSVDATCCRCCWFLSHHPHGRTLTLDHAHHRGSDSSWLCSGCRR